MERENQLAAQKNDHDYSRFLFVNLFGIYGISTFVGYLTSNPF